MDGTRGCEKPILDAQVEPCHPPPGLLTTDCGDLGKTCSLLSAAAGGRDAGVLVLAASSVTLGLGGLAPFSLTGKNFHPRESWLCFSQESGATCVHV